MAAITSRNDNVVDKSCLVNVPIIFFAPFKRRGLHTLEA